MTKDKRTKIFWQKYSWSDGPIIWNEELQIMTFQRWKFHHQEMLGLTRMVRGLALSPAIPSPQIKMLGLQVLDLQGLGVKALGVQDVRHGHNSIRDLRKDYSWKRERPLGPHRHKPPNLIGNAASLNYNHKVHYPEDGRYTVKPLKITKLGGRHPITGRKVKQEFDPSC